MPELKRVIAASGDRVVMEETLEGALAALFKEAPTGFHRFLIRRVPPFPALCTFAHTRLLSHYNRALERLKSGDWAGFGAELDALRPLLEQLSQNPGDH